MTMNHTTNEAGERYDAVQKAKMLPYDVARMGEELSALVLDTWNSHKWMSTRAKEQIILKALEIKERAGF